MFTFERFALIYFLKYLDSFSRRQITHILLPDFMCHEVVKVFQGLGLKVIFYKLDEDLGIDREGLKESLGLVAGARAVLLVYHAYGRLVQDLKEIHDLCQGQDILVLEDCAHLPYPFLRDEDHPYAEARFYSLRKTYAVPNGAIVVSPKHEGPFRDFLQRQTGLFRDRSLFRFVRWYVRETGKSLYINLGLPYKKGYEDLSRTPLGERHFPLGLVDRLVSETEGHTCVLTRRKNYAVYESQRDVFKSWARPLSFDLERDVPYQLLLFLRADLDPIVLVKFFRDQQVGAVVGMALHREVLERLPPDHGYHRQLALPLHQDLGERHIERVIAVCHRVKREFGFSG